MELIECPPKHVEYLSLAVAQNAATLHGFKYPACPGVRPFPCGDHFHIGHPNKAAKEACAAGGRTP